MSERICVWFVRVNFECAGTSRIYIVRTIVVFPVDEVAWPCGRTYDIDKRVRMIMAAYQHRGTQ